jgi:hypothetical protein
LSLFAAPSRLRQLSLYGSKGMVSQCKCQRMQARRTREIRLERMFGNVPVHTRSTHLRGIVCANPSFHCMSPGSVSRYSSPCFPLRSILTRRPAPGVLLLGFRTREGFSRQFNYLESSDSSLNVVATPTEIELSALADTLHSFNMHISQ